MKFLLVLISLFVTGHIVAAAQKPNILVIVGDDMGYADVGFHNCKDIPTPNLDAFAASGVRFTNGYVSGPYCSPTRAGLLTGRYQTRFGHEFNSGGAGGGLPVTETTLADHLKTAGYTTGAIGKWHLGGSQEKHPQKRGFDEFFGFLGGSNSYFDAGGIMRGTEPVKELDYTTDSFGREAVAFIERHKTAPWFLYLAFNAVHTPMHATDDRLAKFPNIEDQRRKTYAAMMLAMDEAVGKVRAKLAETSQAENTLITFMSDNGGPTMALVTANGSRNDPLRGSKRTTLEGGVRVPFVVAWPGHVKPGVFEKPAIQLDLHATALAAAGVEARPEWKLEGVNLLPFLSGEKSGAPHEALYWRFGEQMAIRDGDFKLVRYDGNADTNTGGREPVTAAKLYNLASDIHEDKDLIAAMPDKAKELQAKWDEWNKTNIAPGGKDGAARGERKQAGAAEENAAQDDTFAELKLREADVTIGPEEVLIGGRRLSREKFATNLKSFAEVIAQPNARVDARGSRWHFQSYPEPTACYPISIRQAGDGLYWGGGLVVGTNPLDAGWLESYVHKNGRSGNGAGVFLGKPSAHGVVVDGVRIHNVWDGIRPRKAEDFTIKNCWMSYIRDDAVENDALNRGTIDDCLLDGVYTAFSCRKKTPTKKAEAVVRITNCLIYLQPMPKPFKAKSDDEMGHNTFFKWCPWGPKLILHNNIFLVTQTPHADGANKGIPKDKVLEASNNTLIWTGKGEYPGWFPDSFHRTSDISVWQKARQQWIERHPQLSKLPSPIIKEP